MHACRRHLAVAELLAMFASMVVLSHATACISTCTVINSSGKQDFFLGANAGYA